MQSISDKTRAMSTSQNGAALFMALIFLIILTILGVFGMNASRLENQMAGNSQFQTTALNNAEYILSVAIDDALAIKSSGTPFPSGEQYYDISDAGIDPEKHLWNFSSKSVSIPGGETGSYIIENAGREGEDVAADWDSEFSEDSFPVGVSRLLITAQSGSSRGARRVVQSVLIIDPPIPY